MKNTQTSEKYTKYAVSAAQMRRCDESTISHFGVPGEVLMERAALSLCEEVTVNLGENGKVFIFAGSGNNGGDGIALSRLLFQEKIDVELLLVNHGMDESFDEKRSGACNSQLRTALKYGVTVRDFASCFEDEESLKNVFRKGDVLVDAMLGIGCSRDLSGEYERAVRLINSVKSMCGAAVIAADIPTGINADDGSVCGIGVMADETVTFGFRKMGLILHPGCEYAGDVILRPVGITEDGFLGDFPIVRYMDFDDEKNRGSLDKEERGARRKLAALLPDRKSAGNKGTFGKVLVIAGSRNVSGAMIMASESCLRSGAGMVRVFTEKENLHALQTMLPEAMYDVYDADETDGFEDALDEKLSAAIKWADSIVCGPGIGTDKIASRIVSFVLKNAEIPLVLDADALNIISADDEIRSLLASYKGNKVLTPHLAEFSRLCKKSVKDCMKQRLELPGALAKEFHASIICKDARTVITDGDEFYINLSGNDGMATAGSGDVLAGMLGAFVNFDFDSFIYGLACAVYIHGCAGDMAALENGKRGMTARDITDFI